MHIQPVSRSIIETLILLTVPEQKGAMLLQSTKHLPAFCIFFGQSGRLCPLIPQR